MTATVGIASSGGYRRRSSLESSLRQRGNGRMEVASMDSLSRRPFRNNFQPLSHIHILPSENDPSTPLVHIHHNGLTKHFSPHHVSSAMLSLHKRLMQHPKPYFLIPAYFSFLHRISTRRALSSSSSSADVHVTLVDEPFAASVAYRLHLKASRNPYTNVLVFDLGASSLQVSILTNEENPRLRVIFTSGPTDLGGEDFTNRLLNSLAEEFRIKHGKDISGNPSALKRLRRACERAKRFLSSQTRAGIEIDSLYEGVDFRSEISRSRFEGLNKDLFDKCIEKVKQSIERVEMDETEFEDVVLVGGSSFTPKLQELLKDFFDLEELHVSIPPNSAVLYGSIKIGASLKRLGREEASMFEEELLPLGIGIEMNGGVMNEMIPMNSRLPTESFQIVSPACNNQTSLLIKVYQGERARTEDNYFVGTYEVKNIPAGARGWYEINVCVQAKAKGVIEVSAYDMIAGAEMGVTKRMRRELSHEEVERMMEDAERYKEEDEVVKKAKAKSFLEGYVYVVMRNSMRKAKARNWWKLSASEKNKAEKEINETIEWVDGDLGNAEQYEAKLNELQVLWKSINDKLNSFDCKVL
ncbi:heat shock 70 kDa protein 5 [Senna tora]|uniref:Heat shock 70 kDa protein 5 n=1 Tax=Senna tora TaxID=362788 RepID=A0A834XDT4_9FABA|nr:heat shock 70 kDa protein 5 [Senna tora]